VARGEPFTITKYERPIARLVPIGRTGPGLFEAGFGLTLGEIVDEIGGGTASGRPGRAVQVGGPSAPIFRVASSTRRSPTRPLR
jgi:antitoxin (DNA-binding transcriptional repressor) of toxin-antitoxin stability system